MVSNDEYLRNMMTAGTKANRQAISREYKEAQLDVILPRIKQVSRTVQD